MVRALANIPPTSAMTVAVGGCAHDLGSATVQAVLAQREDHFGLDCKLAA